MAFSPFNPRIKLCLQGIQSAESGDIQKALSLFEQALNAGEDAPEKFYAAFFLGKYETQTQVKIKHLELALQHALVNNDSVTLSALPTVYSALSNAYKEIGEKDTSEKYFGLAASANKMDTDNGPFYHGTKADLNIGDYLEAGKFSNYQAGLKMQHIYFTASADGAGLAACLATGDQPPCVYEVMPTGKFENDPNVSDQKFPGNPTRSYRSELPLKIIGICTHWQKPAESELQAFKQKIDNNRGKIINE